MDNASGPRRSPFPVAVRLAVRLAVLLVGGALTAGQARPAQRVGDRAARRRPGGRPTPLARGPRAAGVTGPATPAPGRRCTAARSA